MSESSSSSKLQTVAGWGLLALGIQKGDRVALFCSTRYEFTLLDYAIWAAGAVTVTIYDTASAEQVEWIAGELHLGPDILPPGRAWACTCWAA